MRAQLALIARFVLTAIVLSSCAGAHADTDSPDYAAGYGDGCATGQARGGYPPPPPVRDDQAFNHSADYKAGWRSGYNACLVRRDPQGP
jgi:hypothetical protein